ncbi:MAG: enoyl-CoA hydratase [Acidimicrobiia bacterium]|nr:enoyl-CoA hydratase [Acidimicrobiia bacterium]
MALVRTDVDGGVGVVTLDDSGRRNALSLDMVDEIVAAFDGFEADDSVAAVVVTGAPPAFCAGADLSHLGKAGQSSDGGGGLRSVYDGFLRVQRSTLPTVAAVNGAAVGAGVNLALACDVRIAGRSAKFDTRFLQLGLHPGGGHTWMMTNVLGPQGAAATVLFGDVLDGDAAERHGLAWRCVDDDRLLDEALAFAGKAAKAPPALVRRVKQTLGRMPDVSTSDEAVSLELEAQLWSMQQPDFAERLSARRSKK